MPTIATLVLMVMITLIMRMIVITAMMMMRTMMMMMKKKKMLLSRAAAAATGSVSTLPYVSKISYTRIDAHAFGLGAVACFILDVS